MKKIYLLFVLICMGSIGYAQPFTYSQSFTNGVAPTTQCTAWRTFRASLLGIYTYSGFKISSSLSPTGYTCTNSTVATAIATALRTGVATTLTSDGHTWYVGTVCGNGCAGDAGPTIELAVDQGTCSCGSIASVRPEINNFNWGGVNGATCGAASQTLTVVFDITPPTFNNGTAQAFSICENASAYNITSLLHVSDVDAGQTETWTVSATPNNGGTLAGFSTANTASSGTANITPGNIVNYTPAPGFSGSETFAIQVSDGILTATTTFTVTVNPAPTIHTFTGGGGYCSGNAGVPIGLTLSDAGFNYQLYRSPSTAIGLPVSGTGAAIGFGIDSIPGYYYAIATNTVTACTSVLSGVTVSINPLPDTFRVTGTGSYCAGGTGFAVGLNGSVVGISYQLYNGVSSVGSPVPGTGSAISFGLHTAGVYTAVATNNTTLCVNNMPGSAIVTAIPLPNVDTVTVSAGGHYCAGGTGVVVGLSGSDIGVVYHLYRGSTLDTTVNGTGGPISFGLQTVAGTYTVNAHNTATTCNNNMWGHGTIIIDALPTRYNVTPAFATLCFPGPGDTIKLSGSQTGKRYQLYLSGTGPVGTPKLGTGSAINFGLINPGLGGPLFTYSVVATDTVTLCTQSMLGSARLLLTLAVVPTVSLVTNVGWGNAVCLGRVDTFKADTTNANSTFGFPQPTFIWTINSVSFGTPGPQNTIHYIPANGDTVKVTLISAAFCARPDTVSSMMIVSVVDTPAAPSVFIDVSPITSINPGRSDTLRAIPTNGGSAPLFQWYKNGTIIPGATNAVYISNTFVNHDSVSCRMITKSPCDTMITFNSVIISVYPAGITQVTHASDIKLIPNPNKSEFMIRGTLGSQADEEVSVEITNMIGQVIYRNKIMAQNGVVNERIQLNSTLANGMYLLSLKSVNGNNVFRFVIEQ